MLWAPLGTGERYSALIKGAGGGGWVSLFQGCLSALSLHLGPQGQYGVLNEEHANV